MGGVFIFIILLRSMLLDETQLEKDIERSLDRLKIVIKDISAIPAIPAFYYSVS